MPTTATLDRIVENGLEEIYDRLDEALDRDEGEVGRYLSANWSLLDLADGYREWVS